LAAVSTRRYYSEIPIVAVPNAPLRSEHIERNLRRPSFAVDVLAFTALAWLLWYGALGGLCWLAGWPWQAAASAASLLSLPVLFWRGREYDLERVDVTDREWQQYLPVEAERPVTTFDDGRTIRLSRYAFPREAWARFAANWPAEGQPISRRHFAVAGLDGRPLFANLTERYPDYYAEFERIGWIEDGRATAAGPAWFASVGLPHSPHPGQNSPVGRSSSVPDSRQEPK
jgi:hypothetical protein